MEGFARSWLAFLKKADSSSGAGRGLASENAIAGFEGFLARFKGQSRTESERSTFATILARDVLESVARLPPCPSQWISDTGRSPLAQWRYLSDIIWSEPTLRKSSSPTGKELLAKEAWHEWTTGLIETLSVLLTKGRPQSIRDRGRNRRPPAWPFLSVQKPVRVRRRRGAKAPIAGLRRARARRPKPPATRLRVRQFALLSAGGTGTWEMATGVMGTGGMGTGEMGTGGMGTGGMGGSVTGSRKVKYGQVTDEGHKFESVFKRLPSLVKVHAPPERFKSRLTSTTLREGGSSITGVGATPFRHPCDILLLLTFLVGLAAASPLHTHTTHVRRSWTREVNSHLWSTTRPASKFKAKSGSKAEAPVPGVLRQQRLPVSCLSFPFSNTHQRMVKLRRDLYHQIPLEDSESLLSEEARAAIAFAKPLVTSRLRTLQSAMANAVTFAPSPYFKSNALIKRKRERAPKQSNARLDVQQEDRPIAKDIEFQGREMEKSQTGAEEKKDRNRKEGKEGRVPVGRSVACLKPGLLRDYLECDQPKAAPSGLELCEWKAAPQAKHAGKESMGVKTSKEDIEKRKRIEALVLYRIDQNDPYSYSTRQPVVERIFIFLSRALSRHRHLQILLALMLVDVAKMAGEFDEWSVAGAFVSRHARYLRGLLRNDFADPLQNTNVCGCDGGGNGKGGRDGKVGGDCFSRYLNVLEHRAVATGDWWLEFQLYIERHTHSHSRRSRE